MRYTLLAALVLVATFGWSAPPPSPPLAAPTAHVQLPFAAATLISAERDGWQAWKNRQFAPLSDVSSGFKYTENGKTVSREQYLRAAQANVLGNYELSNFRVEFASSDRAEVVYDAVWERYERSKKHLLSARVVSSWQLGPDGIWHCAAADLKPLK